MALSQMKRKTTFNGGQKDVMIRWEILQIEIRKSYGKFRPRNDLKYQWNRKRRQILRKGSLMKLMKDYHLRITIYKIGLILILF
jgi:hypothetical protein